MSLASVFNELGQTIMPTVFAEVMPDTLNVIEFTNVSDNAGGQFTTSATVYEDVSCVYEPMEIEYRRVASDKTISIQQYRVTFATHDDLQARIDIDPRVHRLNVIARGNEPAKVFRIIALRDISGVVFEAVCEREN